MNNEGITDYDHEQMAQRRAVEDALATDREAALRDVFAVSALAAIISRDGSYYTGGERLVQAVRAYDYAEAMLVARKQ